MQWKTDLSRRRLLTYALVIILIGLYATTGWLALHPNTTSSYRRYYITEQDTHWEGMHAHQYSLGTTLNFSTQTPTGEKNATQQASGWYGKEPWGEWTKGKNATLYFRLQSHPQGNLTLQFHVDAIAPTANQQTTISVNGRQLRVIEIPTQGFHTYTVTIPAHLISHTQHPAIRLRYHIHKPTQPSAIGENKDTRELGIGFVWLKLSNATQTHQ